MLSFNYSLELLTRRDSFYGASDLQRQQERCDHQERREQERCAWKIEGCLAADEECEY